MEKTCFVIMPFSKTSDTHTEAYWTRFYEMIQRITEQLGYTCSRSEVGPYKLFSNIVDKIKNSDLVVAVLTDNNANVWYELGIRHTLRTSTVMVLQHGQKVPFDVSDFGVVFYEDTIGIEQELRSKVEAYLNNTNPHFGDSPVLTVLRSMRSEQVEKENIAFKDLVQSLDSILKIANANINADHQHKRILWVNDFSNCYEKAKGILGIDDVLFEVKNGCDEVATLYKNNTYEAVVVDVGSGENIDDVLAFVKEIRNINQKAYFIFFGESSIITKYGNAFTQVGAPAVTNDTTNVITLLKTVIEGNPYL